MIWNFWRIQISFEFGDCSWFPRWGKYGPQSMPNWIIFRWFVWGPLSIRYFPQR